MRVLTSSEMRELDERTISEVVPSRVLMERAGVSVVMAMEQELGNLSIHSYLVLVGKGNNGGDGLVVARTLLDYTPNVIAVLLSRDLKGDPLENLKAFENLGGEVLVLGEDIGLEELEHLAFTSDVIVDALLGIGIRGNLRENVAKVIDVINESPAFKVCVDVPSGIDSDTGKVMGTAVRCDLTVTFACPKIGHILFPGRKMSGKLKVASIGIPRVLIESSGKRFLITEEIARSLVPERPKDSNKGTFGKVLIIGGSVLYSGAPVLSALGSMKSGAGLTIVLTPREIHTVVTANHPEAISIPLKSCGGFLCEESLGEALDWIEKASVVVLGPGLGLNENTIGFVKKIVEIERPLVIDADALNALSKIGVEVLKGRKSPAVLTPHPGEFSRLAGKSVEEVKYNYELAEDFAKEFGVVLVLKDATTIITDGDRTFFNTSGDVGLAKGGSGDVLSGIIGSFIAQKLDPIEAAILGVYVHGAASRLFDSDQSGLLPSEVASLVPRVLKGLRR